MSLPSSERIHASCVAIGAKAVLLCGASGSGKSDLALRLIDRGARLVADDYTIVARAGDRAIANAPTTIKGQLEAWGVGIVSFESVDAVEVALMVLLDEPVARMPEPATHLVAGLPIRTIALDAFRASTPIKVELALKGAGS